jgi:glutamate N-acetyltransferase/amino-acid N-acetyltransferase
MTQPNPLPQGFLWGAVRARIKASGNPDLAVAHSPQRANAAAMFTGNQVVAAPITIGRRNLNAASGRVSTVLVNAGNANCATGEPGLRACLETCQAAAETFGCSPEQVFPSSTGIIGVPLPAQKILAALPALAAGMGATISHAEAFATAIMTTDTRMKSAHAEIQTPSGPIAIFGTAKGAGMIFPQLDGPPHATMLAYLFTDADASPAQLQKLLANAVEPSFNAISIDGDTSTNDTCLLLASGATGIQLTGSLAAEFQSALNNVCASLAHQIVDDGEGVGHVVRLAISGARSPAEARQVARAIAHSPLNKTAWSSADPNWGRLLAAAGNAGVALDPARLTIRIGDQLVFEHGLRAPGFDQAAAHQIMQQREYTIELDLGQGDAGCRFLTCDLTEEYVRINADYST